MYFHHFKFWVLSNRQTKEKSNIQGPGGEHLNLIPLWRILRRENTTSGLDSLKTPN